MNNEIVVEPIIKPRPHFHKCIVPIFTLWPQSYFQVRDITGILKLEYSDDELKKTILYRYFQVYKEKNRLSKDEYGWHVTPMGILMHPIEEHPEWFKKHDFLRFIHYHETFLSSKYQPASKET